MATAGMPTDSTGPSPDTPRLGDQGEAAALRKLVTMCSHLSALASQAVEFQPIVKVLAERTGSGVAVVDQALEVLAYAGVTEPDEVIGVLRDDARQSTLRTVLAAAARTRRALAVPGAHAGRPAILVAPVLVGEEVAGYLLVRSLRDLGFTEDMRLLATEHGAMVCGIVLGRDLVVTAAAGRARQELAEGLLLSRERDDPEVQRWARHLGLDPTREHFVMSFEIPGSQAQAAAAPTGLLLSRNTPDAVLVTRTEEVVAILPVSGNGTAPAEQGRGLARACLTAAGMAQIAAVGIGTPSADAAGISRSYAEARWALAAARRTGRTGSVSAFADLGIHRLLLHVPEVSNLRSFADEVLGVLSGEQGATGADYLDTLAVYFRENASPARAGRLLHVHPNTVSYRIRRIEELTGLSFSVHRDRLMAEVAVEILVGLGRSS